MGKDKKNKKGKQEEDFGEEEVEKQVIVDEKPGKKVRKGKSKEVDDSDEDVPKKKDTGKSKKKQVDSDDDNEDIPNHKPKDEIPEKKGKKKGKKVDILSDDEMDDQPEKKQKKKGKKAELQSDEDSDNETASNKKSKAAKGKKNEPKEKKLRVKDRKESSDEEEISNNQANSKKGVSAFALLDVEDMDIDMGESSNDDEKELIAPKPDDKKAGKKSKKKDRKKKQDDDDEDLEKMLEEMALEIEGKKPAVPKEKILVDDNKVKQDDEAGLEAVKPTAKAKKGKKNEQTKEKEDEPKSEVQEMDTAGGDEDEVGGTVKTAAQKKKEKKERERLKKMAVNAIVKPKKEVKEPIAQTETETPIPEKETTPIPEGEDDEKDEDDDEKSKKKKKKGKGVVEDDKTGKKKPGKKQLAAMQDALKKMKEEDERLRLEEEAKEIAAQKAEEERLEKVRLELEKKEKKKQKEKEKKERLKAEGKLLTKAQKQAKARAEATLLALRQQGIDVPKIGEKVERAPRLGDRKRPPKKKMEETETNNQTNEVNGDMRQVELKIVDSASSSKDSSPEVEEVKESWEDVVVEKVEEIKETWDESSEDESKTKKSTKTATKVEPVKVASPVKKTVKTPVVKVESKEESDEDEDDEDEESSDESQEESSDDSEASEDDRNLRQSERIREKVLNRIQKRKEENEKNIKGDKLRSPVVCVLGHVDTGKTKILDKIRNTHVQDGEAGGITQQIGATMVPKDTLKDQCKMVKNFVNLDLKLPGLLIIDTPGHESFSNLRSRGSSLCDIAILVVDIMHGLEPQTIESLNMLKQRKTPFIVALNKIDRLYEWKSNKNKDVQDVIRSQQRNTKLEFEERTKEIVLQFNEQGLNAALCYENTDQRTYVSLVPTSAVSGDGMGNLLGLVVELSQSMLAKRLSFSDELQATVLEVKAIPGLGTTIDVILVNGRLREGDTIVLAGHEGAVITQIRSLLMPQPLKELRVKNPYQEFKEVEAAQGVKIAGKDLDKAIAGLQLLVANHPDETDVLKEEVSRSLKEVMNAIKLSERGVYVQASTLGSLEALLEFLRTSKISYSGIRIGPVVKKDVMKASIMLEHDNQYAVILAFDVKIERDAQELADSLGVKIFQANIIYHLFDKFTSYREDLKQKKRNEFKHIAVFPCKIRILPQFIFNSRDPIVIGVSIEAGVIKEGTPLCVPSRENLEIGTVTTIEINHKTVETARKGQEVCIKIEPLGGEAPKMYGRHFDNTDALVSKITRQSIDACKEYFRDDLTKTDWQLMVELKKMFQIL